MRKEGRTVEGEGNVKEIFDKNSIRVVYMCVCVCVCGLKSFLLPICNHLRVCGICTMVLLYVAY